LIHQMEGTHHKKKLDVRNHTSEKIDLAFDDGFRNEPYRAKFADVELLTRDFEQRLHTLSGKQSYLRMPRILSFHAMNHAAKTKLTDEQLRIHMDENVKLLAQMEQKIISCAATCEKESEKLTEQGNMDLPEDFALEISQKMKKQEQEFSESRQCNAEFVARAAEVESIMTTVRTDVQHQMARLNEARLDAKLRHASIKNKAAEEWKQLKQDAFDAEFKNQVLAKEFEGEYIHIQKQAAQAEREARAERERAAEWEMKAETLSEDLKGIHSKICVLIEKQSAREKAQPEGARSLEAKSLQLANALQVRAQLQEQLQLAREEHRNEENLAIDMERRAVELQNCISEEQRSIAEVHSRGIDAKALSMSEEFRVQECKNDVSNAWAEHYSLRERVKQLGGLKDELNKRVNVQRNQIAEARSTLKVAEAAVAELQEEAYKAQNPMMAKMQGPSLTKTGHAFTFKSA